jgi:hypothetical protein
MQKMPPSFITWKAEDPDIPILREAKAEYQKLTATPVASAMHKN